MCGCGRQTSVIRRSSYSRGEYEGHHRRFVRGHSVRKRERTYQQAYRDDSKELRECGGCGVEKPVNEFTKMKRSPDGLGFWCIACRRAYHERTYGYRREKMIESARLRHLRIEFGITGMQWQEMFQAQGGVCALCRRPERRMGNYGKVKRLAVDHDHTTGRIRGLLCHDCNLMVYWVEKISAEMFHLMEKLPAYLERDPLGS